MFTLAGGATVSSDWNGTLTQTGTTVTVTAPPHGPSLDSGSAVTLNQAACAT